MMTSILIGRDQECRLLNRLTGERKNILILGAEGVGKSAMIDYMPAGGPVKNILYSKRSGTQKETAKSYKRKTS